MVAVVSDTPSLGDRICSVAAQTIERLAQCHLPLSTSVTIRVATVVDPAQPHCLGIFDCQSGEITLLHPDALEASVTDTSIFKGLPIPTLFDSLIAHELTHAAVDQVTEGRQMTTAEHEYMAYAQQLEALSDADQVYFLEANRSRSTLSRGVINDTMLAMAPGVFASAVWLDFSSPGNRCATFRQILDGDLRFKTERP